MAQFRLIYLLRPGTQERWRRLFQEIAGSRWHQFVEFCQQKGISRVQASMVQTLRGETLLLILDVQEQHQPLQAFAVSVDPFDRWLREQLNALFGWSLQDALFHLQEDVLLIWQDERRQNTKN